MNPILECLDEHRKRVDELAESAWHTFRDSLQHDPAWKWFSETPRAYIQLAFIEGFKKGLQVK